MIVIKTIPDMTYLRLNLKEPVGFVPTMGYLHEGHMSLVRKARAENKSVVVSIYVNPTQFGPKEDLSKYPRDLARDLAMLEKEGADVVFFPSDKEMYPAGYDTWVTVDNLTKPLEGDSRPTHFRGVTTIVTKLIQYCPADQCLFRTKRRPAGSGNQKNGHRPQYESESGGLPYYPRTGRPGDEQPQRLPEPGTAESGAGTL